MTARDPRCTELIAAGEKAPASMCAELDEELAPSDDRFSVPEVTWEPPPRGRAARSISARARKVGDATARRARYLRETGRWAQLREEGLA